MAAGIIYTTVTTTTGETVEMPFYVDDTGSPTQWTPVKFIADQGGDILQVDASGRLAVTIASGTVTTVSAVTAISNALPAGTNAIGKLAANSGVDIGDVDVTTLGGQSPAYGSGANGSTVLRVGLATDSPGITALGQTTASASLPVVRASDAEPAHDAADSGIGTKITAKAETALSTITKVADADRTDLYAGVDGVLFVRPHCNLEDIVSGNATNTDGSSTQCIAAQTGSIKTYLISVVLCNTSSSNITVDIKDGTSVKTSLPLPANSGCIYNPPVPIPGTAATAWNFDPSAAASTVTCSMVGFKSLV